MCKERGVKAVISTDSHNTANLPFIRYGVTMARGAAWLAGKAKRHQYTAVDEFLAAPRPKPGAAHRKHAARANRQRACIIALQMPD